MTKQKTEWELVDDGSVDQKHWAIRIKSGKFEGVEYKYGAVKFNGEDNEGNALVRFEYGILEDLTELSDSFQEEFEVVLGEILHDIMTDSIAQET